MPATKSRISSLRLVGPMTLVMLAVAAILIGMTFYSGRVMDGVSLQNQRELVDNALTNRLRRGLAEMRGVAWWDDMVTYTAPGSFDREWLDIEVGSYMVESNGHTRFIVVDERNRPIYSYGPAYSSGTDMNNAQLVRDLGDFAPYIRQARGGRDASPRVKTALKPGELYERSEEGRKFSRGFGGVTSIDGKPAIALAMLITPSYETAEYSPTRRLMLSVVEIDEALIQAIRDETVIADLGMTLPQGDRSGHMALSTDDGRPLLNFSWTPKKPGTEMIQRVLPFIIGALGVAALLMGYLLSRLSSSTKALARREVEARFLADHDALTGLPNRRMLKRLYDQRMNGAKGTETRMIVACVDLDRFKDINDTMGHQIGDGLIKTVGDRLLERLDAHDTLARIGGDEYAILRPMPWMSNVDGLSELIASCFKTPFEVNGQQIETNASVGIAFADPHDSFDQSLKRADIALYDAKASGRGRSSRFTAAMSQSLEKRHAIEIDLRKALAAGDLSLHYQPIVEARSGAITAVEALVRWTSAAHGSVSPELFVAIAEESGMMADLGRFVINRAFEDARRWPDLTTAINISPAQLRSATIIPDLLGAAKRNNLSPDRFTLEITESVLMSNDDRTLRVLNQIKSYGFTLALDDFGTGYSSLAYVRDFPFDKLKIDRSFVKGLNVNDRALAIVEAVVNFGHILGREIVAEGIETEQEMQAMQQAGCTHLQGWLFSKALPADHVEALAATFGRLSARRDVAEGDVQTRSIAESAPTRRKASMARPRGRQTG
jgi:diguanylate cyclase (GGDEF)-like protein